MTIKQYASKTKVKTVGIYFANDIDTPYWAGSLKELKQAIKLDCKLGKLNIIKNENGGKGSLISRRLYVW